MNANAHGISLHAGVRNLANGNCAFETVIDSIYTRKSFPETIDEVRYLKLKSLLMQTGIVV